MNSTLSTIIEIISGQPDVSFAFLIIATAWTISISIIASIIASLLFLYLTFTIRPKAQISPKISSFKSGDGDLVYGFKFINSGKRDMIDIRADAALLYPKTVQGGVVFHGKSIDLVRDHVFKLQKYRKDDMQANYAYRLITKMDIEELWDKFPNAHIRFRIIATDSISGFKSVFSHEFYSQTDSICKGSHGFGTNLDVS